MNRRIRTIAVALTAAVAMTSVGTAGAVDAAPDRARPSTVGGAHPARRHLGQSGKQPSGSTPACRAVAHVGDSTTVESYDQQVAAYAGWFDAAIVNAGGGRAVLQKLAADDHTGVSAVGAIKAGGYSGCWVVALGTNDAANISAGANYSRADAIDAMLVAIDPAGGTPVVWVETFTTKTSGHWHHAHMDAWNAELRAAADRWPNLEVLPWSEHVAGHVDWLSDGIHHTETGRAARSNWIAANAYHVLGG